nr:hypothetical protein [Tanacetum cinerariifolium]
MKKGEYDILAMKMEYYLEHTDYPIWEVIQKGNDPVQVLTDTHGQIRVLPPKTAKECRSKGNQDSRRRDVGNTGYKARDNGKRPTKQDEHKAMAQTLRSSDVEDSPVNDRFEKVKGMHAVFPLMTGNYMPPKFNFGIDESKFTYGPKQSTTSESNAKSSDLESCDSNSSVETLESFPKPVANEPKGVSKPKVWSDAPIIEEYESDNDDEHNNPHQTLKGKGIIDSGYSRHMTGNKAYLVDYQDFNGGPVAFGGSKGQIIKKGKLDFEGV